MGLYGLPTPHGALEMLLEWNFLGGTAWSLAFRPSGPGPNLPIFKYVHYGLTSDLSRHGVWWSLDSLESPGVVHNALTRIASYESISSAFFAPLACIF